MKFVYAPRGKAREYSPLDNYIDYLIDLNETNI